jgi:hypothetical protein
MLNDRRLSARKVVNRPAKFQESPVVRDCTIRDISDTGVRLVVPGGLVSDQFTLFDGGAGRASMLGHLANRRIGRRQVRKVAVALVAVVLAGREFIRWATFLSTLVRPQDRKSDSTCLLQSRDSLIASNLDAVSSRRRALALCVPGFGQYPMRLQAIDSVSQTVA